MEIKKVSYNRYLQKALDSLKSSGAFLTVHDGERLNTMTIGWVATGIIWGKPMMMVLVRKSRFTYNLIEKAKDFTVSFDFNGNMKKELSFCGSNSGRDVNKFEEADIDILESKNICTPFIKDCNLFYECKIKFKNEMSSKEIEKDLKQKWYAEDDYHVIYYGEIIGSYLIV